MADESTIKINLVTAGDPKGAQQVEKAIDEVKDVANAATTATKSNTQANDQLDRSQERAAGSSRSMGNALLQGSRAIQDMQYGLAGAVNNLEGIASALGLGAGVAGVVTVLAVGLQAAAPHIEAFFNSLDTDKIKTDGLKALTDQLAGTPQVMSFAERSAAALTEELKRQNDELKAQSEALKHNLEMLEKKAQIEGAASKNKLESDIEDIKAQGLPKEEEAAAIAAKKSAALDEEFAREQALQDARLKAADDEVANRAKGFEAAEQARAKAQEDLRRAIAYEEVVQKIARAEQELPGARAASDLAATAEVPDMAEVKRWNDRIAELEGQLKELESKRADIFTSGPLASKGDAQANLGARQKAEQERAAEVAAAVEAAKRTRNVEALDAQGRLNDYQAGKTKIAREQSPGVYNPSNLQGAGSETFVNPLTQQVGRGGLGSPLQGGGPRPLPVPVRPAVGGGATEGGNLAAPLQQAANSLQGNPLANLASSLGKPLESIATSVEAMNKSAQEAVKKAEAAEQRLKTLEAQQKNNR